MEGEDVGGFLFLPLNIEMVSRFILYLGLIICRSDVGNSR